MIFKFLKGRGAAGNTAYEAGCQSVHKDLKIQRLQQQVDDLKAARKDLVHASMQLIKVKDVAVGALTGIGNAKTSGGGQASQMAFHAREALKTIKELDK
jgi:hypothetical protein